MQNSTSDIQSLAARIEKLESQNRWFKRGACATLLLFGSVLLMGQAKSLPDDIEARSFVLRDSSGIKRAELTMGKDDPVLSFFDSKGVQSSLVSDGLVLLADPKHPRPAGYVVLGVTNGEPRIALRDSDGFSADLGVTDTSIARTGEQRKTSAASLVLFGKNGKVLWSAP